MSDLLDEWHELSDEELALESWRPEFRDVPTRPFDLERCISLYLSSLPERPSQSTIPHGAELWIRDWCESDGFIVDGLLTVEEARWWFLASTLAERLADDRHEARSRDLVEALDVSQELSADAIHQRLRAFVTHADGHFTRWPKSFIAPCVKALSYLLPTDEILRILFDLFEISQMAVFYRYLPDDPRSRAFVSAWLHGTDLEEHEVHDLVQMVRIAPAESSIELVMREADERGKPDDLIELARAHPEAQRFVETLLEFRRPRWTSERIRECFARSGFARLDDVALGVARARPSDQREAIEVLIRLHTPRIVDGMLNLSQKSVVRPAARKWLNDEGRNAIHRLIEIAASRKKTRLAAREILRGYVLDGRGELVLEVASHFGAGIQQKIESLVSEHATSARPELPKSMRSGWLAAISHRGDEPMERLADRLPELATRDGYRLGRKVTGGLLSVLSDVSLATHSDTASGVHDEFDSGLSNAAALLDPSSAATFFRALFETWVREENPAEQRWKLFAAAFVHGPTTTEFLGDALSRYTRWMRLEDAPFALDTLRALGSARAIYEIERVRQRTRNGRIREHAELVLASLADARRLTIAAMLDQALTKVAPTGGAEPGSTERDRRLRRRLDQTLARRLENAMTLGSTWQPMTWREFFVDSEGGGRVSRHLLWQVVDDSGEEVCMRIDESGEGVGIDGKVIEVLEWQRIGVAHAASLTTSELSDWNETFAQHEIIQPFLQLNRTVYRRGALTKAFRAPSGQLVDGVDLWNALRRTGWKAVRLGSNRIGGFMLRFEERKTIAQLEIDRPFDVMSMRKGGLVSRRTTLEGIAFRDTDTHVEIDEVFVHPVVFSESHLDVQKALVRLEG